MAKLPRSQEETTFTSIASCQGITLNWGTTVIGVTRLSYSRSSPDEIDITSMESFHNTDSDNSDRRVFIKEVDYTAVDLGEVTCDFFGPGKFDTSLIGMRRSLTIAGMSNSPSSPAYLTQMSTEVVAGDLIKGTCTFKLTR